MQGGGRNDYAEQFCEYFGRQFALPAVELLEVEAINGEIIAEMIARFQVGHMTLIHQLMQIKKLPRRILFDSGIGEVPNPFYSGRVQRNCICLDCENGQHHSHSYAVGDLLVLDMTAFELADKTSFNLCNRTLDKMGTFRAVNEHYGLWTDENEGLLQKEIERESEMRKLLGKASRLSVEEDDMSFQLG
jgi:hypothetical protein